MKTFWYATLVTITSLVLGTLVSQSFGADRGGPSRSGGSFSGRSVSSRSFSGGVSGSARSVGQVRPSSLNSSVSRKISGSQGVGGFRPPIKNTPIVNPRTPIATKPIGPIKTLPPIVKSPITRPPVVGPFKPPVGPIKPPVVVGPIGPIKPPSGPIKPPVVGPIGPIKPPEVGPIGPIGPSQPPVGPIKPPVGPPIVGPIGPIGPITPPICPPPHCPPPHCPPKHCPPHCGPWYPLPGWVDCYRPSAPICVTLPTYVSTPVVTETVVVETPVEAPASAAPASEAPAEAPAEADATEVVSDEKLMQVPVGATLQLSEKSLGESQGQVVLQLDAISFPAQVNNWNADQVNVTLPTFGLATPTKAHIWLMRADGEVANKLAVELMPLETGEAAATTAAATTAAVTQN